MSWDLTPNLWNPLGTRSRTTCNKKTTSSGQVQCQAPVDETQSFR